MHEENLKRLGLNDVILAGYPGSGSVWLGCLLVSVGIYYLDGYHEILLDNRSQKTKKIEIKRRERLRTYQNRDILHQNFNEPIRVIKTHFECCNALRKEGLKYILLVRDPRDSILSYYYWLKSFTGMTIDFDEFLSKGSGEDTPPPGISWLNYYNSWLPLIKKGRGVIVSFEKMKKDPLVNFTNLLSFLVASRSIAETEEAIARCSFSAMQKDEIIAVEKGLDNQGNGLIMRSGKPQGWKTSLTNKQIDTINNQCGNLYSEFGYNF